MIKYYHDVIQGTDEWIKLKMGILSASQMSSVITPAKLQISKSQEAKAFYDDILSQRIDDTPRYNFVSDDMLRGHEDEPYAVEVYEKSHGLKVDHCGFITNDEFGGLVGYSPDGLVGDDGLIEIKSRTPKLQTKTILDHVTGRSKDLIPNEFMMQCQAGLLISGRKWIDFISFCNGHPMVTIRVEPIAEIQEALKEAIAIFESALQENMEAYLNAVENDPRLTKTERREIEEMRF